MDFAHVDKTVNKALFLTSARCMKLIQQQQQKKVELKLTCGQRRLR